MSADEDKRFGLQPRVVEIYERVTAWQRRTFPGQLVDGIREHMRKELDEIRDLPLDVEERADMAILAMSLADKTDEAAGHRRPFIPDPATMPYAWGCWEVEHALDWLAHMLEWFETRRVNVTWALWTCAIATRLSASEFLDVIELKMTINESRVWPKPEDQNPARAIEHIK